MTGSEEVECSVDVNDFLIQSGEISFYERCKNIALKSKDGCAEARTTWWGRVVLEHFACLWFCKDS